MGSVIVYRVKTTLKRYHQSDMPTKTYAYHVSEIEVLTGNLVGSETDPNPKASTSVSGDILLNGVENGKGVKILGDFSRVVDENGEPKVVYHGTPNKFSTFDYSKIGSTTDYGILEVDFILQTIVLLPKAMQEQEVTKTKVMASY